MHIWISRGRFWVCGGLRYGDRGLLSTKMPVNFQCWRNVAVLWISSLHAAVSMIDWWEIAVSNDICFVFPVLLIISKPFVDNVSWGLRAQWKAPPVHRCRSVCKAASVDPSSTFAQFISIDGVDLGGCSPTTVLIQGMKRNDLKSSIFNALDQDLQRNQDIKKRSAANPNPGYLVSISEMILARYGDFNQLSAARMAPMNQPT